jgi:fumarylacetoacetase
MMPRFDATTDPALASWIESARGSDFPIQNLPYGAFRRRGETEARLGAAIGDRILDLGHVARAGLLDDALPDAVSIFSASALNALLAQGRPAWQRVRRRISELVAAGNRELVDAGIAERALVAMRDANLVLPVAIGDYVDFYSSREHASNLGKMLRPDGEPLLPNWRWLPVGYHGRASSVVVSDTPIERPRGQVKAPEDDEPRFGPTRMLDFELEVAFVTGEGPGLTSPIEIARSSDHVFGVALLNDWSARDLQAWEYQPLGPFLSKSFATSLSPWIVTLDALEPFRVDGPEQDPPALPHLAQDGPGNYDIALSVELQTAAMARANAMPQTIARTNSRGLYWSMAQQLAHLTSSGARIRAGDLFASGTISGTEPASYGSLIELTWRGARPLALADGTTRTFLEDGDAITLRGSCDRQGATHIGLGSVTGTIR